MSEPLTDDELQSYRGYTWGPYDTSRLFATIDDLKRQLKVETIRAEAWTQKANKLKARLAIARDLLGGWRAMHDHQHTILGDRTTTFLGEKD